jgi:hypothetical protein
LVLCSGALQAQGLGSGHRQRSGQWLRADLVSVVGSEPQLWVVHRVLLLPLVLLLLPLLLVLRQ